MDEKASESSLGKVMDPPNPADLVATALLKSVMGFYKFAPRIAILAESRYEQSQVLRDLCDIYVLCPTCKWSGLTTETGGRGSQAKSDEPGYCPVCRYGVYLSHAKMKRLQAGGSTIITSTKSTSMLDSIGAKGEWKDPEVKS